jgi:hypothetical protein
MRTVARSTSLAALALVPMAAVGGCFSSNSTTASKDASTAGHSGPPPAAGGTGAFGIITVGGKQKMYLPQSSGGLNGNASIAVVDVGAVGNGVAGAPAQITRIDLGSADRATATGGDSTVVIAVSTDNNSIRFIDPTTDTLTKTITLDSTFGRSNFSGGGGYVTGVAIDSAHHRAILSVWNGIALVDLATQTISTVIQAPPTENFGFDSVHQWVIAPFYDCSASTSTNPDGGADLNPSSCGTPMVGGDGGVITDGLSVIDLADNTVYTYLDPTGPADAGLGVTFDPMNPVGREPDSAAADPNTGIVVIPAEGEDWQNVIDLSKATFDKATRTVTAPHRVVPNLAYDGVAVEATRHLAFWEQEFDSTVAVADLGLTNGGSTAVVQASIPSVPGGGGFQNIGDPHGIAVTTAITTAGPVGFVVNSDLKWVARIDLAGMLAAGGPDASAMLTDVMMSPFVTFLDALTPENAPAEAGAEGGDAADDAAGE